MNDKRLEKKIEKDIARVKKEIGGLSVKNRNRFSGFVNEVSMTTDQAKENITTCVEEDFSQLGADIGKYAEKAKSNVIEAAETVKIEIEHGLSVYNAKAQSFADKALGDLGEQAAQYPWVVGTIALGFGVLIGSLVNRALTPLHKLQTN